MEQLRRILLALDRRTNRSSEMFRARACVCLEGVRAYERKDGGRAEQERSRSICNIWLLGVHKDFEERLAGGSTSIHCIYIFQVSEWASERAWLIAANRTASFWSGGFWKCRVVYTSFITHH